MPNRGWGCQSSPTLAVGNAPSVCCDGASRIDHHRNQTGPSHKRQLRHADKRVLAADLQLGGFSSMFIQIIEARGRKGETIPVEIREPLSADEDE
jgi:hypothetical protein